MFKPLHLKQPENWIELQGWHGTIPFPTGAPRWCKCPSVNAWLQTVEQWSMLSQLNLSVWLPGCTVDGPWTCTDNSMVRRVSKSVVGVLYHQKKDEGTACWNLLDMGCGILFHHFLVVKQSFQPVSKDWQKLLDPTIQAPKKNCCRETIVLPTALLCSDHGSAIFVHCNSLSGLSGSKTTLKQWIEVVSWRTSLRQKSSSFLYFGWPYRFDQTTYASGHFCSGTQKYSALLPRLSSLEGLDRLDLDDVPKLHWHPLILLLLFNKKKKGGVSYVPQTTRSSWIFFEETFLLTYFLAAHRVIGFWGEPTLQYGKCAA